MYSRSPCGLSRAAVADGQQGLRLAAENQLVALIRVEERLHPESISNEHEPISVPERGCEHPVEPVEEFRALADEADEQHLGVRPRAETVSSRGELVS